MRTPNHILMDSIAFHFLATKLANIYDTVIYKAKKNEVKFREIIFCQTHNLEVPGSSPGWSTLLLQRLTLRRRPLFLVSGYFICYAPFILIVIIPISPTQHHFAVKPHCFVLRVCRSRTHKKRSFLHSNDYPLHNQTACGRNTCCSSHYLNSSSSM